MVQATPDDDRRRSGQPRDARWDVASDEERDGPDEVFTLATDVLAVDGPTAVVRAEVRYGDPLRQEYRDLWIMQLREDGRCSWFEEWPYWPGQPGAAGD
jgi:hypothetical protein